MQSGEYYKGKTMEQLLDNLVGVAEIDSPVYHQIKMAIFVRAAESLATAAKAGWALAWVVGLATVAQVGLEFWKYFHQ